MSELKEINEDNCVLDEQDLSVIDMIFNNFVEQKQKEDIPFGEKTDMYFLKIMKLNDLEKEKNK